MEDPRMLYDATATQQWPGVPLGALDDEARASFYDSLSSTGGPRHFFASANSGRFEAQTFRVGHLLSSGEFVSAEEELNISPLENCRLDLKVLKFFAAAMPQDNFCIQLAISARHSFATGEESIGHSLAVDGQMGDYANILNVPVFTGLHVKRRLHLSVGIIFVSDRLCDRATEILKSDSVRKSIEMTTTYNPVYGAAIAYIKGLCETFLQSRRNRKIIEFQMGFQSKVEDIGLRLYPGTYVLVQVPRDEAAAFRWTGLVYDRDSERVSRAGRAIDYNHLLLEITRTV
jgi:hypothetical protein